MNGDARPSFLSPVVRMLRGLSLTMKAQAFVRRFVGDPEGRRQIAIGVALAGLYVLMVPGVLWERSAVKELSAARARYREYSALVSEYRSLKEQVDAVERKKNLTQTSTIAQAIGDMAESLGIAGKVKSIKGTGTRSAANRMTEESAEIQIEKVTMNETLQLLYKIENAPMILAIKTVAISKSFENPKLLDLTIGLSLFTGAPAS